MSFAPRVLVVEDDQSIQRLYEALLSEAGYEVVVVAHGSAALQVIDESQPSVIVLDIRMPVMTGWEFAQTYRTRAGPQVPIIVVSAAHDVFERAVEMGAAGVLTKPFDMADLLDVLARNVPGS